ncbi:unnamed protein product [Rotaria magnacalcarata]|uniref:Centlein n=7 Tax=Rotaria magnacalcarata TaxID=392030 RepID=A0A819UAF8_9BILA|nr:unnamed protein product [Rotaria magnacalcarata]CAF2245025.1 unnamed protein product [Rotaria magnacalcarata]CAF4091535.1 unnamed protein product [Rotaria magnacalcarata]CAF4132303.1 unnamed protein product [Rotaria magnacalcarata]
MERGSLGQLQGECVWRYCSTLAFIRSTFNSLANTSRAQGLMNILEESKFTNEQALLNNDDLRFRNREQLIEKLERVIQEKNASIVKLEEREQYLEDTLKKRNAEFVTLEEKLRKYEEKTHTFEQLHRLQLQTFEKTIRDCQIENERLCENIHDLTRELQGKTSLDAINQEKVLTFDRIVADTQLWREKLDSYKATIEQREETIVNLKKDIDELQRKKQSITYFEDDSLRLQITSLQNSLRDRDNEIKQLKLTLRRVRDTLQPNHLSHDSRWKSCSEDIGRNQCGLKSSENRRSISPDIRNSSSPIDIDFLKTKFHTLTDRLNNVQKLLVNRDNQIFTLKKVHDKRWLRLKHLQKQYRLLKDELQSYTDEEILQVNSKNDFSYRKAIRKTKNSCSVCNDQRWKRPTKNNRKLFKQEDDDQVWNEVTKLRREHARLTNENLSLQEKVDIQEVEIKEQITVIDELRNEIRRVTDKDEQIQPKYVPTSNNDQTHLIEKLDKKLYELETERTCLIFENERLKTNLNLCIDEKQHLLEQKMQVHNELKSLKLRILALQDQIHKLKRTTAQLNDKPDFIPKPISTVNRRIIKKKSKKPTTKSCLELLLDQNSTLIDDLNNESIISYRRRNHSCSLCDHSNENSFRQRKRRSSKSSIIPRQRYGTLKRISMTTNRFNIPFTLSNKTRKPNIPVSIPKTPSVRISILRKRIEELDNDLTDARQENEHLNQRLTTTLSRINILKTLNQKLAVECDKFKTNPMNQSTLINHDSAGIIDTNINVDNLHERLKNTSFDAAQQRKLNKSLQADNELLNKNFQSLTEKLTHAERDIASKRLLIENYKTRLNEIETNHNRSNDNTTNENDDGRVKSLTESVEKLRISIDSYKNRLQAITREKHDLDSRYTQLVDEHQKLKIRFEDNQSKSRSSEQQIRQIRLSNEKLNQELTTSRQLYEQQLLILNTKSQDSLKKITTELDRTFQRLNDYERFIHDLFQEMIRRSTQINDKLKRAREHQKQRESLSMALPGFDSAMHTASKILNLTQDDLDEIMSIADESFQTNAKDEGTDKNEKIRQKVSKLLITQEECASKLLKVFSKKLDEIQATDRELAMIRSS